MTRLIDGEQLWALRPSHQQVFAPDAAVPERAVLQGLYAAMPTDRVSVALRQCTNLQPVTFLWQVAAGQWDALQYLAGRN